MTLEEVQRKTKKEPTLQRVAAFIRTGKITGKRQDFACTDATDVDFHALKAFCQLSIELTVNSSVDIILRGPRLDLPASLHQKALTLAHAGHLGVVKSKQLLREKMLVPKNQ